MNRNWLKINPSDNVAVALKDLTAGEVLNDVTLKEDVAFGHKIALQPIEKGGEIIKYGYPIGEATTTISSGDHVHCGNIRTLLNEEAEYTYEPVVPDLVESSSSASTFMGYPRKDGRAGTRNEIWIINTVGCVNKTAERLAHMGQKELGDCCDGVFTFSHPYGCSQLGEDHDTTAKILADLVKHPNAGGVLVLGLGCENNNISSFQKILGTWDEERVKFLNTQDAEDELIDGLRLLSELAAVVARDKREACPLSQLVIGMKCGGSDGLSGITANPLVGSFSDRLVAAGGTTILTEVPEMFGAETILMNRCVNNEVYQKTVSLIEDFKDYFVRHGQTVYENPSPGNKEGGISTLEDKSLGCIQKGGKSSVSDVIAYGDRTEQKGLILLNGPGNDIVSTTALTAAGANLILFTTGRGTPLGAPVPTVKISSNTALSEKKRNWIDFNAGVLTENESMDSVTDRFFESIIKWASGLKTRNEENDYREIAIFKEGVTL